MQTKIPPVVVATAVIAAMYGVSRSPLALPFDTGVNGWLSGALIVAGIGIAVLGIVQFRRHGTTIDPMHPKKASALVTSGIFAVTRNPMYLGMLTFLLGVGVAFGSAGALIAASGFVPLITVLQIRAEEAAMRALFGETYEHYAARVRRWL